MNRSFTSDPASPFAGVNQNRLGRNGGFNGIDEFLETKFIGVNIP
jgi:succinate-semialdehyde dehydrogenase/glutarate-semialdehyde dehydrogenase